jgi:acid phosphatase family membrane protein YuiD
MLELSPYISAIIIAWVAAQGSKVIIHVMKTRTSSSFRHLYLSGNMPSSHSAASVALATVIGLNDGTESGLFGLATLFAAIVMYDAVMVRRSSGEQGIAISALITERKSKIVLPRAAKGHEPIEVIVGALLGLVIGLLVYFVI